MPSSLRIRALFSARASRGGRHRHARSFARPRRRATAVTVVVALTSTLLLFQGQAATAASTGTLTKSGKDLTTGSTTAVTGGDTVQYVLGATNATASTAQMQVTDALQQGQLEQNGSASAPPGYQLSYSTDGGSTYQTTEPASGVNAIRAAGTAVPGSKGAAAIVPTPNATIGTSVSQGDGFQAIFANGRVYNVHHHRGPGNTIIDCHVQATGDPCPSVAPGFSTWPAGGFDVSTVAGTSFSGVQPIVSGSPITSSNPFAYFNTNSGKLYVPVGLWQQSSDGLLCLDLNAEKSCGYTEVYQPTVAVGTTATGNGFVAAGIAGGATIGTRFFMLGEFGHVYCADISSGTPVSCAGGAAPFNSVAAFSPDPTSEPMFSASTGAIRTFDGRHLFVAYDDTQSSLASTLHLGCVDAATPSALTTCAGFTPAVITNSHSANEMLPVLDSSGAQTGICVAWPTAADGGLCYDMAGNSIANPYPTATTLGYAGKTFQWGWNLAGAPAVLGSKVYFTVAINGGASWSELYTCHDFAAASGSVCSGFTPTAMPASPSTPNLLPLRNYTLTPNPVKPNCLFAVSDSGVIDILNATTGQNAYTAGTVAGCAGGRTTGAVSVTPAAFYCDGASGHTTTYDQLSLLGLPPGVTFTGTLTVTDQSGNSVLTKSVTQKDFPIDLSSITTASVTTLHASLSMTVSDTSTWGQATPSLQVTFKGDAPQVCF